MGKRAERRVDERSSGKVVNIGTTIALRLIWEIYRGGVLSAAALSRRLGSHVNNRDF